MANLSLKNFKKCSHFLTDLKSVDSNIVWVRLPPALFFYSSFKKTDLIDRFFVLCSINTEYWGGYD